MPRSLQMTAMIQIIFLSCLLTHSQSMAQRAKILLKGKLKKVIIDGIGANPNSKMDYYLEHSGKHYRIESKDKSPIPFSKEADVTIEGELQDSTILIEGASSVTDQTSTQGSVEAAAPTTLTGTQRVGVIIANLADSNVACSASSIQNSFFGSTNSVDFGYRETSYGAFGVSGTVFNPVLVSQLSSTSFCDFFSWTDSAKSAAVAAGYDLSGYDALFYVFPQNSSCAKLMGGASTLGGTTAASFYCNSVGVAIHELGHTLGFHHAATDGTGAFASSEYGDNSDFMGNNWYVTNGLCHNNLPHKEQQGWIVPQLATSAGTYTLTKLSSSLATGIKIPIPGSGGNYYYVSYRSSDGIEANMQSQYKNVTSVHKFSGGSNPTYLQNLLGDGMAYIDSANGISIRQISHDANTSTVAMDLICTRNTPQLTLSPASAAGFPGATRTYAATLNNKDSSFCPSTTFNLSASIPLGWNATALPPTLLVSPGQSVGFNIALTSATMALEGNFAFSLTANDPTVASGSVITSGAYFVDKTAPSIPSGVKATSPKKGVVTVTWTASQDNYQVQSYQVFRNGVLAATVNTPSFSFSKLVSRTTQSFYVKAVDEAGNISAQSAVASVVVK